MSPARKKAPKKGAPCTLRLPDGNGELTIIPHAVYAFLGKHGLKDREGWYDAWMLRQQYPHKNDISFFSALPERVVVWPTMAQAVAFVEKYNSPLDEG